MRGAVERPDQLHVEDEAKASVHLVRSAGGALPACSVRLDLFKVTRAVTLTTESRGNPVALAGRYTLPGMVAKAVLDVMTATWIVARRLWL